MFKLRELITNPNILIRIAIGIAFAGIILWVFLQEVTLKKYGIAALGTAGDFFGGTAGPLLNFASMLLLLAAFMLQREDLNLTRTELELTRQEFIEQNTTLTLQRFENTFFSLLTLYNQIVEDISIESSMTGMIEAYKGRPAFSVLCNQFEMFYLRTQIKDPDSNRLIDELTRIYEAYSNFFEGYQHFIGHYFRHLYQIIRFIDEFSMPDDEKAKYIRFFRAQLSSNELVLLLYNSLSEKGYEKFLPLLKKYNFFYEHIETKDLINSNHIDVFEMFDSLIKEESILNYVYK